MSTGARGAPTPAVELVRWSAGLPLTELIDNPPGEFYHVEGVGVHDGPRGDAVVVTAPRRTRRSSPLSYDANCDWALYPWFEELGPELIHPVDIDAFRQLFPYGRSSPSSVSKMDSPRSPTASKSLE
jgi:hypothetical protein